MRGLEGWVTSAVEDNDVAKALVLARSLKRVSTNKPTVVLVSALLNVKNRILLTKEFNQVVCIDQHHSVNGWIGFKEYAKLYAFNLTLFRKCVYLEPGTVALKNCDDIFEVCQGQQYSAVCNNKAVDMTVFCFQPSAMVFEHLILNGKKYVKDTGLSFDEYQIDWLINQKGFGRLEPKYNFALSKDSVCFGNFSIAKLPDDFFINGRELNNVYGILELAALKHWKNIYEEVVRETCEDIKLFPAILNEATSDDVQDSIAIVGISCRYAGASNLQEFWDLLINGHSGIRSVPTDRWTKEHGCKINSEYKTTPAGFLSQPIDEFDGKLFGISPKELEYLDPQQRLLLEVTWEALENACIDPLSLYRSHTGVYVGAWMNDYKDLLTQMGCDEFYRIYIANSFGAAAARISHFLGLTGSSVATESGCSSSMVAVDLACKALRDGETNLAIACGVNLILRPFNKDTMSFIIAADGVCKTFDESADGFGRADGCAVLVLKRYADAIKDGDDIWALIRGSCCVQEGVSRSMGTPTKECEALAMKLALKNAGVHPKDVSYIEAHGTGTPLGDPLEISAIEEVYGGHYRDEPLVISSVKTNIGHTESCSGITGIIKVVASLQNEAIPPHLNLKKLHPKINLDAIPAQIPKVALPWKKTEKKTRFAGVSSFGITGTDGHLILQEAPHKLLSTYNVKTEERSLHLLKLSAKTEEALDAMILQYQVFLGDQTHLKEFSFPDICHTANYGRSSFSHRAVIVAKDANEAVKVIQTKKYMRQEISDGVAAEKICFLFTGQGSQYGGMAWQLYESCPVFRIHFEKCHTFLLTKYELNVKKAMWDTTSLLSTTLYSQTAIFCVEYAMLKLWESWGVKPDLVIGHSLGEFCAAVAANILSLEEALTLVAERSLLVDKLPMGQMLVLNGNKTEVEKAMKEFTVFNNDFWLDYAALNSNEQTVLAGKPEMVEIFSKFCSQEKNMKTLILDAAHAFHSREMDPIVNKYKKVADKIIGSSLKNDYDCKYISGVYGKILSNADSILLSTDYWIDHLKEKVDFIGACNAAVADGCKYFLEVGPHPILSGLVGANSGHVKCMPSIRKNEENWRTILATLSKLYLNGEDIDWKGFDLFCNRRKLHSLPTYPFQRKKYWFDAQSLDGNGMLLNSSAIHPLLGSVFPNASGQKIFQSGIDLRKRADWIKDHCIGKRIIFPGAAFLEMSLCAGHCATEGVTEVFCKPSGPVTIENLKIMAPLALEENKICQLQVILDNPMEDGEQNGMKVQVFRQQNVDGEAPKWTPHCVSYFTPATVDFDEVCFQDNFNLKNIKETCQKFKEEICSTDIYQTLSEVGLKFGPAFQSLQNIWKGTRGILAEVKTPVDWKNYIVHPVLLDSMLQVAMIVQSKGKLEALHVPIEIKKFSWLQHELTDEDKLQFFVYSCIPEGSESNEGNISVLFDGSSGKIIGYMSGMEFAESTVQAIESHLESQETNLLPMYNEIWKPHMGHGQNRINIWETIFREDCLNQDAVEKIFKETNSVESNYWEMEDAVEKLCLGYLIKAYYELGWSPSVKDKFTIDEFISTLGISAQHRKLVKYQMKMLQKEGIVRFTSNSNDIEMMKLPLSIPEANELIKAATETSETYRHTFFNTFYFYSSCGKKFASFLKGDESALSILFPQDFDKPSADSFYSEAYAYNNVDVKTVSNLTHLIKKDSKNICGVLRILEVGAGTGNFTGAVMKTLVKEHGIPVEYTFTDISPAFFVNASKKFEEHNKYMKFQVLNLEKDAKSQGFSPGYFDFIIGGDVIHATKDLSDSISNLRQLLTPKGLLCLIEGERQNHVTCIFGFLDGYWRFTDTHIRKDHPLVSGETWMNLFLNLGFDKTVAIPCSNNFCNFMFARATEPELKISREITYFSKGKWLIFSNMDIESKNIIQRLSLYRPVITVWKALKFQQSKDGFGINLNEKDHISQLLEAMKGSSTTERIEGIIYLWGNCGEANLDQAEISQPFLHLCQNVLELKQQQLPKIFLITKGVVPIGDHLCGTPSAGTLWGMAKSFSNELNLKIKMIDLCPDKEGKDNADDAFYELWNETNDNHVAYRGNIKHFGKLVKTKLTEKPLKLPQCDRFQLVLPQTKAISDLKFGTLGKYCLKENEIEIKVKAAALNFRDVFAVMKPDAQFEKINAVGSDFAGVVSQVGSKVIKWAVGDAVFGCNLEDGALPSHVRICEEAVIKMPSTFTFPEAATLPAVFATAYYSLVTVANMKEGDTVLIHTASGGVGLSAIQICEHIGAKVIATAGSSRKRAYLRSLGIQHVFHSRNTSYEREIMKITNGRGVDIVLNSLTGPGFKEASLNVCGKNARFVEMSKLSVWQREEVIALRSDVDYTIVDLTTVSRSVWKDLFETLDVFVKTGVGKPIPSVRFDAVYIREALTYLQKARHIGKITCVMPETKLQSGQYVHHTPMFNAESTYLITGGLGGIGFEVCKWMAAEGGKNLVICSRSQPTDKHCEIIKLLRKENVNVITKAVDVGDFAMCKSLVDFIDNPKNGLPPLRGIMHAAGVISDATLINQSWEKFQQTYRPKVKGAWNLHILTENCRLEHFVMFSSMASLFGPPGQSNHAASNAYLDALTWYRETMGLPATTVNWGQWGQVGVAAGKEVRGVMAFSAQRGIAALEAILKGQKTQICVVDMEVPILIKIHSQMKPYLQNLIGGSGGHEHGVVSVKSDKFWKEVDSSKHEDKPKVIKEYLKVLLRQILKLDEDEAIDDATNFQDMGMDSLMMIELKNTLQSVLGSRLTIPSSALSDCNNTEALTDKLIQQMNDQSSELGLHDEGETYCMNEEELIKLIENDSKLAEELSIDVFKNLKDKSILKVSEAKVFLLTGVTGKLGPYLLKELLCTHGSVEKVYCLLRSTSNADQRLQQSIRNIEGNFNMNKVHLLCGDVTLPKLGLDEEKWSALSLEVDAVIHCAVKSNHVQRYGLTEMRKVNVIGTKNILEFCCNEKAKYLFHSSSIVSVASTNEHGHLSEAWPGKGELQGVTDLGYPISKMICDRLIHHAVKNGLRAKSFRFGGLTGNSKTGHLKHINNHILLRFLCYMKVGAMPIVPVPVFYIPVDLAAKYSFKIFLEDETSIAPYDIYNLCHPYPSLEQEFPILAEELGYQVEVVEHNEFVNRLANEGKDSLLYSFKELYENEEKYNSLMTFPDIIRKWLEDPDNFFSFEKVSKVIPEYKKEVKSAWDYLRKDLNFAKETGLFKKFKMSKSN